MCGGRQQIIRDADRKRFSVRIEQKSKKSRLEKNKSTEKISFCHDAWMYFFAG